MLYPRFFKKPLATASVVLPLLLFLLDAQAATPASDSHPLLVPMPPMGWNSWNSLGVDVNEDAIKGVADKFVDSGLKDLGYKYIVIDDHWEGGRDDSGRIRANPSKFPHGMKALGEYIHSRGLKFGIYSCAGNLTCGGEVGSYQHERDDAATFAEWGVDYLKYDYCNAPQDFEEAIVRYTTMGSALKECGRPVVFSICEWGPRSPWLWGRKAGGQLWRVSFDVGDMWDAPEDTHSLIGILTAIDACANLARYAGPGGWNDPDMLVVGLRNSGSVKGGGCTLAEYQTQMSMWCMLAAPLMIGCDVRSMDSETRRILTNPEAIAVDQDSLGKQASRVARTASTEVWQKPLADGSIAIAFLNRGSNRASVAATWKLIGVTPSKSLALRDLWLHKDLGIFSGQISLPVGAHATVLLRARPQGSAALSSVLP